MNSPESTILSVRDAAYEVVHTYPGGAMALAVRMGINGMLLSHKVNPNNVGRYDLTLTEAVKAQAFAGNCSILYAMARDLGHVCLQQNNPPAEDASKSLVGALKEFTDFMQVASASLADDRITDNEMRQIDKELAEAIRKCNALRSALSAKNAVARDEAPVSLINVTGR